jgi:hypothetical protein
MTTIKNNNSGYSRQIKQITLCCQCINVDAHVNFLYCVCMLEVIIAIVIRSDDYNDLEKKKAAIIALKHLLK